MGIFSKIFSSLIFLFLKTINFLDNTISDTESDEEYLDGPYVTKLNELETSMQRGDSLNARKVQKLRFENTVSKIFQKADFWTWKKAKNSCIKG